MNFFDLSIISYLNQLSGQVPRLDHAIIFLSNSHLLKGGVLVVFLWYSWFDQKPEVNINRTHIISTVLASLFAILVARMLASTLPFRLRPLHQEEVNFILPSGMSQAISENWWLSSAFPSDHAVLFFALSTGLLFVSKAIGITALLYTSLFIALPRAYLGLHYPTDLVAGAVIGVVIALIFNNQKINQKISEPLLRYSVNKTALFYPILFLVFYQIADMFESSRTLVGFVIKMLRTQTA